MTAQLPITTRLLNFFTFLQKFAAICVLFAVTIGSMAVLLVENKRWELANLTIELDGVRYYRPIMNLQEYLIGHQQAEQRYLMGDKSLDTALIHLKQRVGEALNELIEREPALMEQISSVTDQVPPLGAEYNPSAIKLKWEELVKQENHLTVEKSFSAHLKLIEQICSLAAFIRDATTLQPNDDLDTYYLLDILYSQIPSLQRWTMVLAAQGEIAAAATTSTDTEYQKLVGAMALIEHTAQGLNIYTWKAIKAYQQAYSDLSLKAALEGPIAEVASTIEAMVDYVKDNLLHDQHENSLGTFIITATRALTAGFQYSHVINEQIEQILIARHNASLSLAQHYAIGISLLVIFAFLFSFILFRAMFLPLKNLVHAAERLAKGDLSVRVPVLQSDEIAQVGRAFNLMANSMEEILNRLKSAGVELTTSTTRMTAAAKEQEATIVSQETATKQIAVTAKEISLTATEFAGTIQEVTSSAEVASAMATTGKDALVQMQSIMQNMVQASSDIASQLAILNDKTNTITGVITTITKVADRTNLLSLNAAIEAHKIGDQGGGFSVIAAEIRRLADQTAYATLDIEKVVNEMVTAVTTSVGGMQKFSEDIRKGVEQATNISELLTKIIAQVQQQTSTFEIVNQGMEAQSVGAKQITESIEELSGVAQQSTSSIRQFHSALNQLSTAIKDLQNTVIRVQATGTRVPTANEPVYTK